MAPRTNGKGGGRREEGDSPPAPQRKSRVEQRASQSGAPLVKLFKGPARSPGTCCRVVSALLERFVCGVELWVQSLFPSTNNARGGSCFEPLEDVAMLPFCQCKLNRPVAASPLLSCAACNTESIYFGTPRLAYCPAWTTPACNRRGLDPIFHSLVLIRSDSTEFRLV